MPRTVLLLAFLLFTPAAPAEEEVAAPKPVKAEVAVVASRAGAETEASSAAVLTREEIARLPARSLAELLRFLPAVDVRRRGPGGVQADVAVRGADYNGTLVLVDGEPVNDPQTNHHALDLDVPVDAIERIEVLYGAASALYGSEAVGGVVNVVTRGADLGASRARLTGRWVRGSFSLDEGGVGVAVRLADAVAVSVDGERSESSGFRDDREHSTKSVRATLRVETPLGPVTLSGGGASRAFGAFGFYGTRFPNQQEWTRTRTLRLSGELDLGRGWSLAPSASVREHRDDFVLERSDPAFYRNLHETERTSLRLVARRPFLGGTLAVGAEAGRDTIGSTSLGARERSRSAGFLELGRPFSAAEPSDGGFRAGARVDRHEGFGARLSPQLAAWVALGGGLRARASAGTAFRVPTFTELHYVDPQTVGNPALRPETSRSVEVGLAWDAGPATLDAVVFHRRGTDLVDFVRSSRDEPYRATNLRTVDTLGLEASVSLDPSRVALGPLERLELRAAFVSADLEALRAEAGATEGRYLLDPLRVRWDLIAAARLPVGLAVSARLSFSDRPSWAEGVLLLDARLGRRLLEGDLLEAWVEGENLGDVRYEELPGVPLPGRTLAAGLRLAW